MLPYYQSISPARLPAAQLDQLLALGWYRMHQDIFTTSHIQLGDVHRVHWLRYAVDAIVAHASHKRIRERANNFHFRIENFVLREEHQTLHRIYRSSIDFEGASSITDCLFGSEEITPSIYTTKTISIYDGANLIAAGYFDVGSTSAASILHFFDPAYKRFSLGKYLILLTIDWLKENQIEYYYPGYIVEGNPKMDYKLFLGKEEAHYFDPYAMDWKRVTEILPFSNQAQMTQ